MRTDLYTIPDAGMDVKDIGVSTTLIGNEDH